jgi:hypothetical protein
MQKSTQPPTKMAAIATSACAPMYVYDANEEHEHRFRGGKKEETEEWAPKILNNRARAARRQNEPAGRIRSRSDPQAAVDLRCNLGQTARRSPRCNLRETA